MMAAPRRASGIWESERGPREGPEGAAPGPPTLPHLFCEQYPLAALVGYPRAFPTVSAVGRPTCGERLYLGRCRGLRAGEHNTHARARPLPPALRGFARVGSGAGAR